MLRLLIILFFSFLFAWGQNYSTHIVKSGDTLWELAARYNTTVGDLQQLNGLYSTTISIGQQLYLPAATGGAISAENAAILSGYPNTFKLHIVSQGESLFSIAQHYGLNEDTLKSVNPEVVSTPAQGLALRIPPHTGRMVALQTGESILSLSLKYSLAPSELAESNGVENLNSLEGKKIFIPITASVLPQGSSVTTGQSGQSRREILHAKQLAILQKAPTLIANYSYSKYTQQNYAWPLNVRGRLTSYFGRRDLVINGSNFHAGIDIAAPAGTPILATKNGVVAKAGWLGGYGYAVYVNHNDGTQTRYAHMSQVFVVQSQSVRQGEQLGLVGSTGISTGPHLHFELRVHGYAANPLEYLNN